MYNSLILQYISRNMNKLQLLDYVLLGVVALAFLFALFSLFRQLYRLLTGRQGDFQLSALDDGKRPTHPELCYVGLAGQ